MKRRLALLGFAAAAVLGAGCGSSPTPADYAAEKPVLDLKTYFNGEIVAHGIFTDRGGKVARRFTVQMTGTWNGNQGVLDERFTYSDGKTERRVWKLTDEGNGRWSGRADDVVGAARGEASGSAVRWQYRLLLPVQGRTWEVDVDDWMHRIDARHVLNRARFSKWGVTLGDVQIAFQRA